MSRAFFAPDSAIRAVLGARERMVNYALIRAYEFLGRLTDSPEDLRESGK